MTERSGGEARAGRPVVYCIVPRELAGKLHDSLRRHFASDPVVEVVVERRRSDRRLADERRADAKQAPAERRRIRADHGRRAGERRAPLVSVSALPLPLRFRRYAAALTFVERLEPSSEHLEDLDTARVVANFQAGDREAFATLYLRYFDRVYGYLRLVVRDPHEAEDLAQQSFMRVLERLDSYERRAQPFRAWLFTIVRNFGLMHLQKHSRSDVTDPAVMALHRDRLEDSPLEGLGWLSDSELTLFIERLPMAQRQVIVLRHLLDLTSAQAAEVLGSTPEAVRALHYRALRTLEQRLLAVGRRTGASPRRRAPMRAGVPQARILRRRRFALLSR